MRNGKEFEAKIVFASLVGGVLIAIYAISGVFMH